MQTISKAQRAERARREREKKLGQNFHPFKVKNYSKDELIRKIEESELNIRRCEKKLTNLKEELKILNKIEERLKNIGDEYSEDSWEFWKKIAEKRATSKEAYLNFMKWLDEKPTQIKTRTLMDIMGIDVIDCTK